MHKAAGWLIWNLFFMGLGLIFAGTVYGLLPAVRWALSSLPIETQALAVHVSGLLALAITLTAGYAFHRWINRRKP